MLRKMVLTMRDNCSRRAHFRDVGFALNPMLVARQIHRCVRQGVGWGLHEAMRYDSRAQLTKSIFLNYTIRPSTTYRV